MSYVKITFKDKKDIEKLDKMGKDIIVATAPDAIWVEEICQSIALTRLMDLGCLSEEFSDPVDTIPAGARLYKDLSMIGMSGAFRNDKSVMSAIHIIANAAKVNAQDLADLVDALTDDAKAKSIWEIVKKR